MADENWQQVRKIFDDALRRQPTERRKFVNVVCGDDKTLLAEVESLLSSLDSAESFMEMPAVAKVADVIEAETKQLEIGRCFGHYEIIEQLGMGGMGEVYLARDKKLDRKVAVKILNKKFSQDESNLQRFVSEAKAASALNHPNILIIHEIGESGDTHYIVSEFIKGKTLREFLKQSSLKLSEILDISVQIANSLVVAHEAYLVHRDIKPENIMIRPDGYVKILDFGLAKLVERENKSIFDLDESTVRQNQTAKGVIMGTVNYMSPEQAKGERVDKRTDIFSFGVLIHEMIAGRTPFQGNSVSETFANLINAEPQPLSRFAANVPDELQRAVLKMLRKNKDERYQTMKDVLTDLRDLRENLTLDEKLEKSHSREDGNATAILQATTGGANLNTVETQNTFSQTIKRNKPFAAFVLAALLVGAIGLGYHFFYAGETALGVNGKKSIAILPLKPINTMSRDEIYEIGIADSLILKLSSMNGFIVRPLSATRKYADIEQDSLAAGREQQVDYVLASNYQLAGGKIRITAQLLNAANGQIEETYKIEKDAGDVFAMQDAIAGEVGNKLSARFGSTANSPMAKRGTTNEEAYRLYLQAMSLLDKRSLMNTRKTIENLEQAVKLDPNYAQAWAGKAHAHRLLVNFTPSGNIYDYQKSIEAINKALTLDENLADAHSALCENKMYSEYDLDGAERSCRRAVELDSNSSRAHEIYSRYLMTRGRIDEAIAEIKTAIDIEPRSLFSQRWYGNCLQYARRHEEAVAQLKRVVAIDENFSTAYMFLIQSLEMQGNYDEAFEWRMKHLALQKADEETVQSFRIAYQTSGWQGVLRERVKRFDENTDYYFHGAAVHAMVGNKEKAFEYLEKSFGRHELWFCYLQVDPRFDSLRDDPRFDELVKRVGILQ